MVTFLTMYLQILIFYRKINKNLKPENIFLVWFQKVETPTDTRYLFYKMVLSILCMHGCKVWGYANVEKLKYLYKFSRCILCLNKSTPNCVVYDIPANFPFQTWLIKGWHLLGWKLPSKLPTSFYKLIYKLHLNDIYRPLWLMEIK